MTEIRPIQQSTQIEQKACPFIPPVMTRDQLNPNKTNAAMSPCLGPMCMLWLTKKSTCGMKLPDAE